MRFILTILIIISFAIYIPINSLYNQNDALNTENGKIVEDIIDNNNTIDNNIEDIIAEENNEEQTVESILAYYVQSKVSGLSIRANDNTSSAIIGSLKIGEMVAYLDTVGNWYKTLYKNQIAYVSARSEYSKIIKFEKQSYQIEQVIDIAEKLLGFPYVYGAVRLHNGKGVFLKNFDATKFDCSSLVQYTYYVGADVLLNVNTRTQIFDGKNVSKTDITRGDLLFFTNASRYYNKGIERIGHVAIYLGDNYILHTASDYATIEEISAKRWSYFIEARRVI